MQKLWRHSGFPMVSKHCNSVCCGTKSAVLVQRLWPVWQALAGLAGSPTLHTLKVNVEGNKIKDAGAEATFVEQQDPS